jgi:hypothetical protein
MGTFLLAAQEKSTAPAVREPQLSGQYRLKAIPFKPWIPAFARMAEGMDRRWRFHFKPWIPAVAGMTCALGAQVT